MRQKKSGGAVVTIQSHTLFGGTMFPGIMFEFQGQLFHKNFISQSVGSHKYSRGVFPVIAPPVLVPKILQTPQ